MWIDDLSIIGITISIFRLQIRIYPGLHAFFKSIDKESGEMKGIDTVFEIKNKGILRAQIDLENLHIFQDKELAVRLEWIGPGGESFYSKKIDVKPADTISTITGSISITPDKREPGEYILRAYLFEDLIAERKFVLKPSEWLNHWGTKCTKGH